jgi:lipoate---protein ligase
MLPPPMYLLDLALPSAAENVALDEALLDAAEAGEIDGEVLRLWESPAPLVVVGRSSRLAVEVELEACRAAGVPVIRRASGGAAIVAGPGCLMYAVVLRYAGREHLRLLDEAHRHVLSAVAAAVGIAVGNVKQLGTSDLAIGRHKFSGNSVRCKRDHLLYHGTLLYDFDLELIGRLLQMPPRQPGYRLGRPHSDFVTNLGVPAHVLRQLLATGFSASEPLADWPRDRTAQLVATRYSQPEWNAGRT